MLYFSLLFFPAFFVIGVGILIPTAANFTPSMSLDIIVVSGIIFSELYFGIEKTTLKNNTNTSNYGYKTKLFTIVIITSLITILSVVISILLMMILETYTGLLLTKFVFFSPLNNQNLNIMWKYLPWLEIFYYWIITTLVSISIWMLAKVLVKEYKIMIMVVLVFFLMNLVFGGILVATYNRNNGLYNTKVYNREWLWDENVKLLKIDSFYSMSVFITPTYFMNVLFSNVLRIGASQQEGIYGWSNADTFYFRPDIFPESQWENWMITFNDAWKTGDQELIDAAYLTSISNLNPNTHLIRFNGDGTTPILILAPIAYIIGLFSIGFLKKTNV